MYYFDNASTTFPKPIQVSKAIENAINSLGNASRGSYDISLSASRQVFLLRKKFCQLFNVSDTKNVAFTPNISYALNMIILSLFNKSDHIITLDTSHNSVLRPLYSLECELTILDSKIDIVTQLLKKLKKNTKAFICSHGSNVTGDLQDINSIGNFCKENNILFILDTAQTAGIFPIDIKSNMIDIIAFTGHKNLYGPQGTGGICIDSEIDFTPVFSGGSGFNSFSKTHPSKMPDIFEIGTTNVHSLTGLSAGLDFIKEIGMDNIRNHELELMWMFYSGIVDNKNIKIYGNYSNYIRCPIVLLNIKNMCSDHVCDILYDEYKICVRSGAHCAPLIHNSLGTNLDGAIRFSFSYFNTKEEIDSAIFAINAIANKFSF